LSAPSRSPLVLSRSEAVLVGITILWGATFLVVQNALAASGPLFFVGLRFGSAALVMALVAAPVLRGLTWAEARAGAMIGVAIFFGYTLQTYGLQTIPSSKSAFITALYVPIVPLLQWLILKRPPGIMAWIGIGLAFMGLALLAGPDGTSIGLGIGEFLTLMGAFRANTWVAFLAATGVILSAAYALWLYRRVVYGPLEKPALQAITDLNRREIVTFAPLVLLIIYYGVQPGPILDAFAAPTDALMKGYEAALATVKTASVAAH